ncbi:MAG: CHAT domain-containing protein [Ferruginibacter sp.]
MRTAGLLLILCTSLLSKQGNGQCPNRDSVWNRLLYLTKASASFSKPSEYQLQLKELLAFEATLKNCPNSNDSTNALLFQRIGATYAKLHEFVKAIAYTKLAISTIKPAVQTYPSTAKYLVKNYYNLSNSYGALNKVSEKMTAIDSCINTSTRFDIPDLYYLFVLTVKVSHLLDIGDYKRCYQFAVLGEKATARILTDADSLDYLITFLLAKVDVLIGLKKYDEAKKLVSQQIADCKRMGVIKHLGALYGLLARVEVLDKNTLKATDYFQTAFNFHRSAGFSLGCMQTLNNLAYMIYDQPSKNIARSLTTYKKALSYDDGDEVDKPLKTLESLNILGNIGSMYSRNGIFDSATRYFQLAFDRLGPGINETTLVNHPESFIGYRNIDYIILLIIDKGNAYLAQFKKSKNRLYINEAIRIFKVADRLVNMLKSEQTELESKLFWRNNMRHLYEQAIAACFEGDQKEDAFYFMEKSRAVLLSDQLNQQRLLGEEDILMQSQINKKIGFLQKESAGINTAVARKQAVEQELFTYQAERDRLLNDIKTRNPLYYQSFLDTGFIRTTDVQKLILKDQQSLVELFTGDSAVYVMLITGTQLRLSRINKQSFEEAVKLYTAAISNPDQLNQYFDSFLNNSRTLFGLIFQENPVPPGRMIISPDVSYFPFDALVKSKSGEKLVYFMQDHPVSYTYSARYLLNNFNVSAGNSSHTFMGLAPVSYAGYLNMTDLSGSDHSLTELGNYFPGSEMLLSSKATKNNFLQNFSKYKIVQLYTHAADSTASGEPVIYFADSALYLSELMPENKPVTQLMVLSACETGSGRVYQGEGVFSFNRGFAALGIPSSLANLWAVDDQSTYRLTALFYKYLTQGLPADVALQRAKLDFFQTATKEKQLPYYWAAPIMTGKVITFDPVKKYSWLTISLLAATAIAAIYFIRRFNSSKIKVFPSR